LKLLRDQGHTAQIVEKWNQWAKVRQDLFGCIDILCIQGAALVAIQVTSGTNHAARLAKALTSEHLAKWLATGALFEIHSWSKRVSYKKDGSKTARGEMVLRIQQVRLNNKEQPVAMAAFNPVIPKIK